jgi:hypothetical protein
MDKIAQKYQDRVPCIQKNVEDSRENDRRNNDRFNEFIAFVFKSTLSRTDRDTLQEADKPAVEVNVLEAYISRLSGEFSKQIPDLAVRAQNDEVPPVQVTVIEAHLRSIFSGSEYENKAYEVYRDQMTGGFSAFEVYTEYENEDSMDQVIRVSKAYDPTLCGFDPLAREPSKSDGQFCYKLFPKYREELEQEYPELDLSRVKVSGETAGDSFRWNYKQDNKDVLYICDYYEKQYKYVTLYEISDPTNPDATHTVTKSEYEELIENWEGIQQPPQIIQEDRRKQTKIVRYKFIEDTLVERPEELDYDFFPLIFVDGNSAYVDGKQITRPYVYNAVDAQRIKNLAASNIVNDLENTRQTDVLISKQALPSEQEYIEGWLNPQKTKAALVWDAVGDNGEPLIKPDIFPRSQMNPAFMQVFDMQDKTIQAVLGSYDAQLGINEKQLSGVAIVEGATQSNNAAMPYVVNYLAALNQVAKVVMNLLPKYYKTIRTIPVITANGKHEYVKINDRQSQNPIGIDFKKNDLEVSVVAGTNFDVQRNKAASAMMELSKSSQSFNMWLNTEGLPLLIDNMDIRGKDQIKKGVEEFLAEQKKKQAQAGQKPNPQEQAMQAQIQMEQQKIQIEQKKVQLQSEKQDTEAMIQAEKLKQSQMKLISDIDKDRADMILRAQEAQDDAQKARAETAIDLYDHQLNVLRTALAHAGD